MSPQQLARSPDLQHLINDGYEVRVSNGFLVITHVPYVNSAKEIQFGFLACSLNMSGDICQYNGDHTVYLQGDLPCNKLGEPLSAVLNGSPNAELAPGIIGNHYLSSKPAAGYTDYYHKMTTYVAMLEGPARSINQAVSARTHIAVSDDADTDGVFRYQDTATSRARIPAVSQKLAVERVAIVGLGGTGSYVLDLIAKTLVKQIHLFDGDIFYQHNAFRSPGASSLKTLQRQPTKVAYLTSIYDKQRTGLFPHPYFINESTVDELRTMNFVFLCMESSSIKRLIVERLGEYKVDFIDVGIGVTQTGDQLTGQVRTTTSTEAQRAHVWDNNHIPFVHDDDANQYDQNIQIADLNALNAALAVIKWKKLMGFYADIEVEHYSIYAIDGNHIVNEVTP